MSAPRLEIDLDKIHHNACTLIERLAGRGISVTGVTKAMLGSAEVARVLLSAGVRALGDSRIENIETMRRAGVRAPLWLLRSPMISQVARVVAHADSSCNTESAVIRALSASAQNQASKSRHGIVLMVELGDLREGILPADLMEVVRETLHLPGVVLLGIGTNLACRSGISPDAAKMSELSALAEAIEATFGLALAIVSGGNSANLDWALGCADTGRINDLRLGEAILLGREPLHRQPIDGLHTDAFRLVAEVIESKVKPSRPWGVVAEAAFGRPPPVQQHRGSLTQALLGLGRQDVDPDGLGPGPGLEVLGASSDHLVLGCGRRSLPVGSEVPFSVNYSALIRSMTSPYVTKLLSGGRQQTGDLAQPAFDTAASSRISAPALV